MATMCRWHAETLARKWAAHPGGRDRECWLDLLDLPAGPGSVVQAREYARVAESICEAPALLYDAEYLEQDLVRRTVQAGQPVPFRQRRRYSIGARQEVVVTGPDGNIITCYHEHFDRPHRMGHHRRPAGELIAEYRERLQWDIDAGLVREVSFVSPT